MTKNIVFTATYNECENIEDFLNKVFSLSEDLDVLIIDDNSPDLTWKLVQDYQTRQNKIKLIKKRKKEVLIRPINLLINMQKKTIMKN